MKGLKRVVLPREIDTVLIKLEGAQELLKIWKISIFDRENGFAHLHRQRTNLYYGVLKDTYNKDHNRPQKFKVIRTSNQPLIRYSDAYLIYF